MTNNVIEFQFEGQEVRTLKGENGEPWFVAKDVAEVLGFDHTPTLTRTLDDEEKGVHTIHTLGGDQKMTVINESGLYSAILKSRKPQAKAFKRWVTNEVLPSIRKHGAYMTPDTIEQVLNDPDTIIKLATTLKEEQQKRREIEQQKLIAEKKLEKAQPHIEFSKAFRGAETAVEVGILAKVLASNGLQIGRNRLFSLLRKEGYVHFVYVDEARYNVPTQKAIDNGWMIQTQRPIIRNGKEIITLKALVTPKGQQHIFNKLMALHKAS